MKNEEDGPVSKSIELAFRMHAHQKRKDGVTPCILHPLRVAVTVASYNSDPGLIAAALLHDAIEDSSASWDTISSEVSSGVADMVSSLSEDRRLPKRKRRENHFARIRQLPDGLKLIKLADILDNLSDMENLDWNGKRRRQFISDCIEFTKAARTGCPEIAKEIDNLVSSRMNDLSDDE